VGTGFVCTTAMGGARATSRNGANESGWCRRSKSLSTSCRTGRQVTPACRRRQPAQTSRGRLSRLVRVQSTSSPTSLPNPLSGASRSHQCRRPRTCFRKPEVPTGPRPRGLTFELKRVGHLCSIWTGPFSGTHRCVPAAFVHKTRSDCRGCRTRGSGRSGLSWTPIGCRAPSPSIPRAGPDR